MLFQACFMNCLVKAPSEEPDIWHRLRGLTRHSCHLHPQGPLQLTQDLSESLNRFCLLCAIMDIQAWRKHMQQEHKVAKETLSKQFHEHAALVSINRPCAFCRILFQKSPKLHRSKCLPLAQLLSLKHGYAGVCGGADCGSVGTFVSDEIDARRRTRCSQGSQDERSQGYTGQVPQAGERGGQGPDRQSQAPGASRGRRNRGTGHDHSIRAPDHQNPPSEARPGIQSASSGSHVRALFLDHGDVVTDHAANSDKSLEGAIHSGRMHNYAQSSFAHKPMDGTGSEDHQVRAGPGSFQGDGRERPLPGGTEPLGLHSVEPTGKKAQVTDQPHLSSDELKAAIKTLRAAAMTDGVIHKFAPMQKLGENVTAQTVVFTLVLTTKARAERVHAEMAKLVNSAALSLIGLRLRPEKLQLSPLAKALAGPRP